ncbi:MAG: DUF6308 family protein [Candidatus Helarchaeota archaeon]
MNEITSNNEYLNPTVETFRGYLTMYSKKYEIWDRRTYHIYINLWKSLEDHQNLQDYHIACIFMPFLAIWGKIRSIQSWEGEQIPKIKEFFYDNTKMVEEFRKMELENADLSSFEQKINILYQNLDEIFQIGQTTCSKILHLTAPDFFPILDDIIRKELEKGTEYFQFMKIIKKKFLISKKFQESIELSRKRRPRSKLKVIDEYLWLRAKKLQGKKNF